MLKYANTLFYKNTSREFDVNQEQIKNKAELKVLSCNVFLEKEAEASHWLMDMKLRFLLNLGRMDSLDTFSLTFTN